MLNTTSDGSVRQPLAEEGSVCPADAPLFLAETGFVAESIVDGPGLRCVVFVQGCPHGCPGCHNPATHPFSGGTEISSRQLYQLIRQQAMCRGVTFSGGEPFCQAGALLPLAKQLRADGYELAAYSGYLFQQLASGQRDQQRLLAQLDILIDGPFVLEQRDLSLRFRGSKNQRIINVPRSLEAGEALWETTSRWTG